jgi:hypothetical protein
MIGKPYSGKPNVRFDEGELEIEPFGNYASSLLYCFGNINDKFSSGIRIIVANDDMTHKNM